MLPKISTTALLQTQMVEVLFKSFTISNNREGFKTLFQRIGSVSDDLTKAKVGLEATGHYDYRLYSRSKK